MACDVRSGNASEIGEDADRDVAETIEEGLGGHEILSFVVLNLVRGF
jgi:hypothetical protein